MSKFIRYAAVGAAMASFGIASAAQAATSDSATATATILTALSVTVDTTADTLDFGTLADGGISGTQAIVVDTTGTVTSGCTAPSKVICGGTTKAPLFHVSGLKNKLVGISFANATETLSYDTTANGGAAPTGFTSAMTAGTFVTDATSNQVTLDASGAASFSVGGTLNMATNMAPGIYTGTVTVKVAYN